jgi:GNAT superfamily N-acetyltransferase
MSGFVTIVENVERAAWSDLLSAPSRRVRDALGLSVTEVDSALVLRAAGIDSLLFNRALGLAGCSREIGARASAIGEAYARDGIERYLVSLFEGTCHGETEGELARHGLVRFRRSWEQLIRGAVPVPALSTELSVRLAEPRDAEACARILCAAFETTEAAAPLWRSVIGRPRWEVLVACDGARLAAVAGLFVHGGVGYLPFAATDPAYRRRGAQGALMASRVRRALELGCAWIATETGEAIPGEPNPSYHNMLRCGFQAISKRHNFGPRGLTWARPSPVDQPTVSP